MKRWIHASSNYDLRITILDEDDEIIDCIYVGSDLDRAVAKAEKLSEEHGTRTYITEPEEGWILWDSEEGYTNLPED